MTTRQRTKPLEAKPPEEPQPETDSTDPVPSEVEVDIEPDLPKKRHFIALRRMTYQGRVIEKDEEVVGAADWPRVDAWVRARYLKEV